MSKAEIFVFNQEQEEKFLYSLESQPSEFPTELIKGPYFEDLNGTRVPIDFFARHKEKLRIYNVKMEYYEPGKPIPVKPDPAVLHIRKWKIVKPAKFIVDEESENRASRGEFEQFCPEWNRSNIAAGDYLFICNPEKYLEEYMGLYTFTKPFRRIEREELVGEEGNSKIYNLYYRGEVVGTYKTASEIRALPGNFNLLPGDIRMKIASELSDEDLISFCTISKTNRELCGNGERSEWANRLRKRDPTLKIEEIRDVMSYFLRYHYGCKVLTMGSFETIGRQPSRRAIVKAIGSSNSYYSNRMDMDFYPIELRNSENEGRDQFYMGSEPPIKEKIVDVFYYGNGNLILLDNNGDVWFEERDDAGGYQARKTGKFQKVDHLKNVSQIAKSEKDSVLLILMKNGNFLYHSKFLFDNLEINPLEKYGSKVKMISSSSDMMAFLLENGEVYYMNESTFEKFKVPVEGEKEEEIQKSPPRSPRTPTRNESRYVISFDSPPVSPRNNNNSFEFGYDIKDDPKKIVLIKCLDDTVIIYQEDGRIIHSIKRWQDRELVSIMTIPGLVMLEYLTDYYVGLDSKGMVHLFQKEYNGSTTKYTLDLPGEAIFISAAPNTELLITMKNGKVLNFSTEGDYFKNQGDGQTRGSPRRNTYFSDQFLEIPKVNNALKALATPSSMVILVPNRNW